MNYFKKQLIPLSLLALVFAILALSPLTLAGKETSSYTWMIGTGFLEQFGPVIAEAHNGDTIQITGEGNLSIHPKSVTGGGTFIHRDSEGNVIGKGTWTAVELINFRSFGSGSVQDLPAEFEGGRSAFMVHIMPDGMDGFDGMLRFDCELGDNIPEGALEGVTVHIPGVINFKKKLGGGTLFIRM